MFKTLAVLAAGVSIALGAGSSAQAHISSTCTSAPALTGAAPVLSGSGKLGVNHQTYVGGFTWDGGCTVTYTVKWMRNGVEFMTQTAVHPTVNTNYVTTNADANKTLTIKVSAQDSLGSTPYYTAPQAILMDSTVCQLSPPSSTNQCIPTGVWRMGGSISSALTGNHTGSRSPWKIAILDTGVELHPDLNVVATDRSCVPTAEQFVRGTGVGGVRQHGTWVAGLAAAMDNGFGVVGAAPGAQILDIQVADHLGTVVGSACGINRAVALGANVINMSYAGVDSGGSQRACGDPFATAELVAICNAVAAGVVVVAAAGNSSADMATYVPASYDNVLAVTAMTDLNGYWDAAKPAGCSTGTTDEACASYSNWAVAASDKGHTIAGVGGGGNGGGYCTTYLASSYDCTEAGTSLAAPLIAGLVVNCLAPGWCNGLTPAQIMLKLRNDANAEVSALNQYGFRGDDLYPVAGRYYGWLGYMGNY